MESAISALDKNEKLRGKLINVGERFIGFDSLVRDDAVKRKSLEERRYQELSDKLANLERSVNAEIKRRMDASKTLQMMIEQMANDMFDRLQKKVQRHIDRLALQVDDLNTRSGDVIRGIQEMRGDIPNKLETDAKLLTEELNRLKSQIDSEKHSTLEKDSVLSRRAAEVEYLMDKRSEAELTLVEEQFSLIRKGIDELTRADTAVEDQFRGFTLEELSTLKNGLVLCSQARESSDDEIINAINSYTNALQKILRASAL
eukprot:GDKK01051768.1.p1 GENE.GDKK01051768.1~~GDKK01051768.1.p1  ORF type:complete len:259 (-),score=57.80 GDKK01051768.1:488-1264(-)